MKKKLKINDLKREKTFEEGFKEFLRYCQVRNLRPESIRTYTECVNFTWYKFRKPNSLIRDITKDAFDGFVLFLREKTNEKDTSIQSNIKKMRTILYYFMKLGYMEQFKIENIRLDKEDYLFVTAFGDKCSRVNLVESINTYNRKRGVMRTGVHKFRHTFAKKWVLSGGNIFKLQKVLQHSTMDMVKNYVNIFNSDLTNDFNEFNP